MDNIEISIRGLIKTNNGLFKSEKQAAFLLAQTIGLEYCVPGGSFNKTWTDVFVFDEKGVLSVTRMNGSGKNVEKWNRNGTSETQIKNKKSLDRHEAKIATHNAISVNAEKLYNLLCLSEFGYVVCPKMKEKCWSAISISENKSIVAAWCESHGKNWLEDKQANDEMVNFITSGEYNTLINMREEYRAMYMDMATRLLDIRCKVQSTYPSKFPYTFM